MLEQGGRLLGSAAGLQACSAGTSAATMGILPAAQWVGPWAPETLSTPLAIRCDPSERTDARDEHKEIDMSFEWMREDQSATVIGRAIRAARRTEAVGRLFMEGIALTPAVAPLLQQYAEGALRLRQLVYLAHARAAGSGAGSSS